MIETFTVGWKIPFAFLKICLDPPSEVRFRHIWSVRWMQALGVIITLPMLAINLLTGICSTVFAFMHLLFFILVRAPSSAVQDFLSPPLYAKVSSAYLFDPKGGVVLTHRIDPPVRQFKYYIPPSPVTRPDEDDNHESDETRSLLGSP